MPELIIGMIVLLMVVVTLIGFGVLLGRFLFGGSSRDERRLPAREADLAATSRTIRRLADRGAIDEELRAKLFELLRQEHLQGGALPYAAGQRAPQPLGTAPDTEPATSEPPVTAPAASESSFADPADSETPETVAAGDSPREIKLPDEGAIVLAELVTEEVAPPVAVHPLDAAEPPSPPQPSAPQQRRRALADVLQAFMQDNNIRWGELVSGLLIVGCSIALVISLRQEIENLSERFIYLPALLFMLATAAIHGAGNYTLRRWNLQATSRGVLIIATLLIPINFLAAIIVTGPDSRQLPPLHPLYLSAVAIGVVSFGTMAHFAGQALMRRGSWRLLVGVLGTSVGQLIINRLIADRATALTACLLASVPLAAYLVATIGQLRDATRRPRMGVTLATETLLLLGITSFSLAASIGLLLSRSDSLRTALAWLSTPLALPAVVILATGLALHRRVSSRRLAVLKTIGTSLALTGGGMMLAAVSLAWPQPELLIVVGLLTFVSLSLLAEVGRLPALHVPAIVCASLACLVGFHLWQGSYSGYEGDLSRRMVDVFLQGRSSLFLTGLAALVTSSAGLLFRQGRRATAVSYLAGSGGPACLSLLIALTVGFFGGEVRGANLASPVFLFYALAFLFASHATCPLEFTPRDVGDAPRQRYQQALTWIGSTLLLIGFVHALGWNTAVGSWLTPAELMPARPVLSAIIIHGMVAVVSACLLGQVAGARRIEPSSTRWRQLVIPLMLSGLLASIFALPAALQVRDQEFGEHAWYLAALSQVWLAAMIIQRLPLCFFVFQTLATVAVVFTTTSICQQQSWWTQELFSPRHLQMQIGALAAWSLVWSVGRRLLRQRWPSVIGLMRWDGRAVDEFVLGATVGLMFLLCVMGCFPGAAIELGISENVSFEEPPTWQVFFGVGSWIGLLLLVLAAAGSLIERFSLPAFSALFLIAASAALLAGGRMYETLAVASGLRWSFAGLGVVLTLVIWFGARIRAVLHKLAWLEWAELPSGLAESARWSTLSLTAVPILGLTTVSLVQAATGHAPNGPAVESLLTRMGSELSYGVPLGLLTAVLIAHAVREKKTSLLLAGSAVFQYLVNLAFFLPLLKDPGARMDWPAVIGCMQWNSLGLSVYALAWLAARPWIEPHQVDAARVANDPWLGRQLAAVVWVLAGMAGLASVAVVASPLDVRDFARLGDPLSYTAYLLGFGAILWQYRDRLERFGTSVFLGFLLAVSGSAAISLAGNPGSYRAFHMLMLAWTGASITATALAWTLPRWWKKKPLVTSSVRWAAGFIGLTVLLALRGAPFDPDTPWWSFATTLTAACSAVALGLRTRSQRFAYVAVLLAAVAVTIVWWGAWPSGGLQGVLELVQLNLVAIVATSLIWLLADVVYQARLRRNFDRFARLPAVHLTVARRATGTSLLLVMACFGLTGLLGGSRNQLDVTNITGWILLSLLGLLLAGSLWDRQAYRVPRQLYAWGVMMILATLDAVDEKFGFNDQAVFVTTGLALAGYVALTGHLWRHGATLAAIGQRLGVPDPVRRLQQTSAWLPTVTLVVSVMIVLIQLVMVLTLDERWMRVGTAFAPLLLAYGVACCAQQQRRGWMQYISLLLAGFGAVYAVWADIQPGWRATFVLERAVRLMTVLAGLAFLYAIPVSRWTRRHGGDWFPVVRRMGAHCGAAALAALAGVLVLELAFFMPGVGTPFGHPYQVVAVAAVLVGLIVAFIAMALSPQRDPLALSEQGRTGYVYAAQLVAALLFAHLYLSNPQMFGTLKPYWPYIVMGIAFAGVGIGEVFQRGGLRVLAEPLQRTGGFLPLLPALGWWLNRSLGIDTAGHYSLLLFFTGLLYVAISMLRRSYVSGIAAALAGNAALWALLADNEPLSLLKHPQFWLIPPAVSMLAAAQLNRRRLSETQQTAVRYLCLLVIYVSSTADIFIEGIGNSLWEPMVLATLSVIGVFVGIGLQIRAFLYLGATFVFMSVVSMVWHAYANIQHVGIWWGFGIVLGLLILTIFGVFEKKRPELTRVVEGMRRWEN